MIPDEVFGKVELWLLGRCLVSGADESSNVLVLKKVPSFKTHFMAESS